MDNNPSNGHPQDPRSNVSKFSGYDPDKYILDKVSLTVKTNESLLPGKPPCLTQRTIGMYLQPLTRDLVEVPPRPTIDELPDTVIDHMVKKEKAFWVDKPGSNAYTLHDAYYNYGMTTEIVKPTRQDIFPRSYQYDLDCVRYRRLHACDGLKQTGGDKKPLRAHCRNCEKWTVPGLNPFQLTWAKDPGMKRWRYYPDLTTDLTPEQIQEMMREYVNSGAAITYLSRLALQEANLGKSVASKRYGRPYRNEACNWYYKNYPPVKYDTILRKFSK